MNHHLYDKEHQRYISFPLGGIGTGSVGLGGNGRLIDWEIFNAPNKGSDNGHTHFAVKAEQNGKLLDARILQGDYEHDLTGQYGKSFGFGMPNTSMAGFPHFKSMSFCGEYPLAHLSFEDETFPGAASLCAFNPMIPCNADDSGIPAAFFEYRIRNTTADSVEYTVAASLRNPSAGSVNRFLCENGISALLLDSDTVAADAFEKCDMTLATDETDGVSRQEYWYRGAWFDSLETYWRNFTESCGEHVPARTYETSGNLDMATLYVKKTAAPGEEVTFRFVIAWNAPNRRNYWDIYKEKNEAGEETECPMKNYYAYRFENSLASARYALTEWARLYDGTVRFHDALFSSTLPNEVLDAVSATMSVLKTETCIRIGEHGDFFGWEGLGEHSGSCPGTCTHVWNYAYAMCYLFPELERNIRENDYRYNQRPAGDLCFRTRIPFGRGVGDFRACVDGEMGSVFKVYREWKLSGDTDWMKSLWPDVKRSLEFAWSKDNPDRWDADRDGVLEGRQHHTLDMELFGPSSWLEGFYLCALRSAEEMARAVGDSAADEYRALFEKGYEWTKENLFSGEYFIQRVDLHDRSIVESFDALNYWNEEAGQIKYQIAGGCAEDQLLGQWHADLLGLGDLFDPEQVQTALASMYKYNFRENMRTHYNTFRIFAADGESGAIICTYPDGVDVPAIPIPYAQESMHGFEYAFAGLLVSRGFVDEGLRVVRGVRDRYNGANRNPWNEIECGSNYARSMASFALLPIFSGMQADMTRGYLRFAPVETKEAFACLIGVGNTWGQYTQTIGGDTVTAAIRILGEKSLSLSTLSLAITENRTVSAVTADGASVAFAQHGENIVFDTPVTVAAELQIIAN